MAVYLKKKRKCRIVVPGWLGVGKSRDWFVGGSAGVELRRLRWGARSLADSLLLRVGLCGFPGALSSFRAGRTEEPRRDLEKRG